MADHDLRNDLPPPAACRIERWPWPDQASGGSDGAAAQLDAMPAEHAAKVVQSAVEQLDIRNASPVILISQEDLQPPLSACSCIPRSRRAAAAGTWTKPPEPSRAARGRALIYTRQQNQVTGQALVTMLDWLTHDGPGFRRRQRLRAPAIRDPATRPHHAPADPAPTAHKLLG